jgi:hypothetical protein
VELQRDAVGPLGRPVVSPLAERERRVAEDRAARTRTGLSERLRGEDAEGEPDVDDVGWKFLDGVAGTLDDLQRPAELLRVGHASFDLGERPAVEEVGRMHRVAGAA